jgi:stage II sporulation protein GA (sporulation sigma-E factor processing peptidase)
MEVYIEYVVLDNLIINYVLLKLTSFTLKLNSKTICCFFSSLIGTIFAVLMPFLKLEIFNVYENVVLFLIKMLLGFVMVLLIKKPNNLLNLLTAFFLFLTYTFVMGGMCFGLMYLLNLETTFSGVLLYGFEIPVSIFILLGLMYLKILFGLIKIVKRKINYSNFYYDVKFVSNHKTIYVSGFLDSGNQVKVDDSSVLIINYKTLIKLFPNLNLQNLLTGRLNEVGLPSATMVNITTANGKSKMLTFVLDEVQIIDNKNKVLTLRKQKIGLAKTNFLGEFDCLLSPEIFN